MPQGVEQTKQTRDGAAPEALTYRITPQFGRYLKQLSDGSIAVIDSSRPTLSGDLGPYDPSTDSPPDVPRRDRHVERSGAAHEEPASKKFRTAYCVFTGRVNEVAERCPETTH